MNDEKLISVPVSELRRLRNVLDAVLNKVENKGRRRSLKQHIQNNYETGSIRKPQELRKTKIKSPQL